MRLLLFAMLIAVSSSLSVAQQRPAKAPIFDAPGSADSYAVTLPQRRKLPSELKEGVVVWRDIAEEMAKALSSFATEFKEAHKDDPAAQSVFVISDVYDLCLSIQKDLDEAPDQTVVRVSSHTLESLAKFAFDSVLYWYESQTKDTERARTYLKYVEPLEKIAAGGATWWGAGRLDTDAMQDLIEGIVGIQKEIGKELLKDTFKNAADSELRPWLLLIDFFPEFCAALFVHEQAGYLSLEAVDRYSDAFLVFSASVIVIAVIQRVPGLAKYSETVRNFTVAGGKAARTTAVAKEAGRRLHLWFGGQKQKDAILLQYLAYATRELSEGRQPEAFSVHFKDSDLYALGFSKREVAEIDRRNRSNLANSQASAAHTAANLASVDSSMHRSSRAAQDAMSQDAVRSIAWVREICSGAACATSPLFWWLNPTFYADAEESLRRSGKHRFEKKRPEPPEELRPPPHQPLPPTPTDGEPPAIASGSGIVQSEPRRPPPGGVMMNGTSTTQAADLSSVKDAVFKNRRSGAPRKE